MPENPSLDPRRTVDHVPSPAAPSTVDDTGPSQPPGATGPCRPAPPAEAPSIPGYNITAEIARGGMGRVYAGYDLTLDREVALKTLLPGADAARFVVEARITARLPHPGIPPVHALGALADGTPYLAMKLIRGRTLADLLKERPSPLHELPRFVQVFEQVAQAVGFAHAQGIVHRDLKPLNVMVGAFGEVQVMDWGLAKNLTGRERERSEQRSEDDPVTHTAAGAVLGTPGYMAPEQARGEAVDARADVFALGATLAAILTGQPALVGPNRREVIDRAARAELADVRQRLQGSGADGELLALALRCLAARAEDRPADGRAVAAEVAAYRAGVEARLRQAETARAEALVRETEQRKRRRTVQGAGGLLAGVLLAGLGVSLWQMSRAIAAEGEATTNATQASRNAAEAERNAERARAERDAKDAALQAETQARDRAFAALRSMTDVFEKRFAQTVVLTDDDRAFLRGIIEQFDAFAAIKGDDADSQDVRAEGRFRVGTLRYQLGELKEAEQDYGQALRLQQQLAAEFPTRPEFRQQLAASHNNRGILLRATGRLPEAEQDYGQALRLQQQLAADFANQPDLRNAMAGTCVNLAILSKQQGNWAAAKRHLLEGRPHHLAALKANPGHPTYRQFYLNHLNVLTEVHAGLLEQADAVRTAEKRRDLGWNPPADAYDAGCFLSQCIPIVAKHDKLDDQQRKGAVQFYGDAAMKLLREAVSKGYKDVPHMKKDTDLDPLRPREEFQKLVAELEGKGR
jgi:tetratricopeptide (TPR) repeat protein